MSVRSAISACCPSFLRPALGRIESSPIGYRLARGMFWSMAGAVISRGLMLVAWIFMARILGRTVFGELGMVRSTVSMFAVFAGFGLGLTATKHVAEFRDSDPDRVGRIISLSSFFAGATGCVMAIALCALAPFLAAHTINAPYLSGALRIGAVMLFFDALNGAQTGTLAGFEAFRTIARVNLLAGLLSFPILVAGAYLGGLPGSVWAWSICSALNWLLNHIALRKEAARHQVSFSFNNCLRERSILWSFSLPTTLGSLMVVPAMWVCNAMLVNQPNGYSQMGIYSAAIWVKQACEMMVGMLMAPFLPILSQKFAQGDRASYDEVLVQAFSLSIAVVVPVSLIQMAAPFITLMFYGPEYHDGAVVVQWIMLHTIIFGLTAPYSSIMPSVNRMWFGFAYNVSWAAIAVFLNWILVPRYGTPGLAAGFALTHWFTAECCIIYLYWRERLFTGAVPIVKMTAIGLTLSGLSFMVSRSLPSALSLIAGCVLAFAGTGAIIVLLRRKHRGRNRLIMAGAFD